MAVAAAADSDGLATTRWADSQSAMAAASNKSAVRAMETSSAAEAVAATVTATVAVEGNRWA